MSYALPGEMMMNRLR